MTTTPQDITGPQLRKMMKRFGWTQTWLAKALPVKSERTIRYWLASEEPIRPMTAARIWQLAKQYEGINR